VVKSKNEQMKKVLIITYYWPPCGGIGVLRCLKWAKYLRQHGWEPIIFTAEGAHYPTIDHSNDKDIPEGITILREKIWEPYHIYKYITGQKKDANVNNVFYATEQKRGFLHNLSVWIRSNFFIPDARANWIKPSVSFLVKWLRENKVDALLSNGPPHSNTRIATLLKKATGLPWLADFQDPWSQVDYFSMLKLTKWGLAKHLRMEQEVFATADAISIVSPSWKRDLESIGAKDVHVLPWGYDPDDYTNIVPEVLPGFTITHTGILGIDRSPQVLLNAITKLRQEKVADIDQLKLVLVGLVDKSIETEIAKAGLAPYTTYTGNVSRHQSLAYTLGSQLLLLLLNRQENAEGRIPGKFFEYLASNRPILCIGPEKSDVKTLMETVQCGDYCSFEDTERCVDLLKKYLDLYSAGKLKSNDKQPPQQFAHPYLTGKLASILNDITLKNSNANVKGMI
jgi:hypothetical protein